MIYFIGAGPGDPELLTIKGKKIIDRADVIIYAGSLVNAQVLEGRKPQAKVYNSAYMHLEEVLDIMIKSWKEGLEVARVHTGDPSVFGAIREQMDALDQEGIAYEVIPGVSSFLGAAASLKKEYTLPGVSQTVILTRMEGRTPVPDKEQIARLAAHQSTMIIFLSVSMIRTLCETLAAHYPVNTPVAVVYKATWPDEKIVRGTLKDIAQKVEQAGITKTALILVGEFLGDSYQLSKLYDKTFSTEFRRGIGPDEQEKDRAVGEK
ncbi:precorrin-4/cobalt-precorrin-4 C11-methyltransferase [Catenibacillus scindens]|uniref:Precorrin-4/cobalt-precorrin-4 C11-methyltransferase n=1 Tax=Catenibacillus scindens TaxID=673271 RepID=A0A7W8M6U1_9FIRM|nr:precorrin-4 C(11)-methyltransferase [Catenibacillus scindens]MBB5265942.1 precorrin-4/cobalt-precorrin-4 C11-methyltransferase [Catenibacillus scindens]